MQLHRVNKGRVVLTLSMVQVWERPSRGVGEFPCYWVSWDFTVLCPQSLRSSAILYNDHYYGQVLGQFAICLENCVVCWNNSC